MAVPAINIEQLRDAFNFFILLKERNSEFRKYFGDLDQSVANAFISIARDTNDGKINIIPKVECIKIKKEKIFYGHRYIIDGKEYIQLLNRGVKASLLYSNTNVYRPLLILGLENKYNNQAVVNFDIDQKNNIAAKFSIVPKPIIKSGFVLTDGYKLSFFINNNRGLYTISQCNAGKYIASFTIFIAGITFLDNYQIFNSQGTLYKSFVPIGEDNKVVALRLNEYRGPYLHGENKIYNRPSEFKELSNSNFGVLYNTLTIPYVNGIIKGTLTAHLPFSNEFQSRIANMLSSVLIDKETSAAFVRNTVYTPNSTRILTITGNVFGPDRTGIQQQTLIKPIRFNRFRKLFVGRIDIKIVDRQDQKNTIITHFRGNFYHGARYGQNALFYNVPCAVIKAEINDDVAFSKYECKDYDNGTSEIFGYYFQDKLVSREEYMKLIQIYNEILNNSLNKNISTKDFEKIILSYSTDI